jgi:hypothetical protein
MGGPSLTAAERALAGVILSALPPGAGAPPSPAGERAGQAVAAVGWPAVVRAAERDGLAPLLYAAVAANSVRGLAAPPADVVAGLRQSSLHSAARSMRARAEMARLLDLFAAEGIPLILLKGIALAATVYPDPAQRTMCDLDFLVHREDLARVSTLLEARGYRPYAELSAGIREELGGELCYLPGDDRGYTVEPHWHLLNSSGYAQRSDIAWFWEHTVPLEIEGRQALMLSPEAQVIHLAAHLVVHHQGQGLRPAYDIALVLRRYGEQLDWDLVVEAAQALSLEHTLGEAFGRVSAAWQVDVPAAVLARLEGRRQTLSQRMTLASARSRGKDTAWLAMMGAAPGVRGKATIAFRAVFPNRQFMQWRYGPAGPLRLAGLYAYRIGQGLVRLPPALAQMAAGLVAGRR